MSRTVHHTGTISAPDGSIWTYEIGVTGDARLLWVLRAPDKTSRSRVAPANDTVGDVVRNLRMLVARRSVN